VTTRTARVHIDNLDNTFDVDGAVGLGCARHNPSRTYGCFMMGTSINKLNPNTPLKLQIREVEANTKPLEFSGLSINIPSFYSLTTSTCSIELSLTDRNVDVLDPSYNSWYSEVERNAVSRGTCKKTWPCSQINGGSGLMKCNNQKWGVLVNMNFGGQPIGLVDVNLSAMHASHVTKDITLSDKSWVVAITNTIWFLKASTLVQDRDSYRMDSAKSTSTTFGFKDCVDGNGSCQVPQGD
jgi:hypothetical protein